MFLKFSCVQWSVSSDRARVTNVYINFAYMNINCPLFRPFPFLWNPPYLFTFWWRLKSNHPPFHSFTDAPTQILPGQVIESLQCPIHKWIKGSLSVWVVYLQNPTQMNNSTQKPLNYIYYTEQIGNSNDKNSISLLFTS